MLDFLQGGCRVPRGGALRTNNHKEEAKIQDLRKECAHPAPDHQLDHPVH